MFRTRPLIFFTGLFLFVTFFGIISNTASADDTDLPEDAYSAAETLSFPVPSFNAFKGAVSHTIPISVPPGRNGMAPELKLTYDDSNNNGLLGARWKIVLEEIRRSNKWGVVYSDDDYIHETSAGAKELVSKGGNEYGTKIEETFSRYFNETTSGWLVVSREGTRYYYGRTSASRIDNGSKVYKWALDRIEDTNGNALEVTYEKNEGQLYPLRIDYDANNAVEFVWQSRPDTIIDMKPGWKVTTTRRLEKIITYGNDQVAKIFTFSYERHPNSGQSRLITFQQHSADESVSLPAHTFTWENGGNGSYDSIPVFNMSRGNTTRMYFEDINGDGLTDIASIAGKYFLSNDWVDLDNFVMSVRINNGDGTFQDGLDITLPIDINHLSDDSIQFVQLNKDGRIDLVAENDFYTNNGNGTFSVADAFSLPRNYKFGPDFNRDGLTDIYNIDQDSYRFSIRLSNGDGTFQTGQVHTNINFYFFQDINGDGLTDAISKKANDLTPLPIGVFFGKGDGTFEDESSMDPPGGIKSGVDLNGDGLTDIVKTTDLGGFGVKLSKGNGEFSSWIGSQLEFPDSPSGSTPMYSMVTEARYVELNGDGLRDLIIIGKHEYYVGGTDYFICGYIANGETTANHIATINNGYGAQTTVSYNHLNKDQIDFLPFSMTVASSITTSDGINPASKKQYVDFSGALYDAENREYRGFSGLTEHHMTADGSIYRVVEKKYYQDEYRKGKRQEQILRDQPDGAILTQTTWDWQTDIQDDWGHVRLQSQRTEYEDNSDLFSETTYAYDSTNGLVTDETITGADAETITGHYDYTDYSSDSYGQVWRKTNHTLTGSDTEIARHTTYEYETDTGNLLKETQVCEGGSDNDCNGSYVHTYAYDDYGNLEYEWDPNTPATEDPTTTYEYDETTHTYVTQIINALGHTINQEWDPRYGKITWRQDPNGQVYTYQYDEFGRLKQVDRPDGGQTLHTYQVDSTPIYIETQVEQSDGVYIPARNYLDGLGRTVQTVSLGGPDSSGATRYVVTKTHYDEFGRVIFNAGPFFQSDDAFLDWSPGEAGYLSNIDEFAYAETTYDQRDRPLIVTSRDSQNGLTTTGYSYSGFSTTITDPDNCAKTETKDALDRIIQVVEHANTDITTRYVYNAAGDLLQVKNHFWTSSDPDKNRILMAYNTLGRKIYMDDPDMGQWDYHYDANANLISQTDAKGQDIEFAYDDLNRIKTKTYSTGEPTVTYTYDLAANGIGQVYSVTNTDVTSVNTAYDEVGRVTDQQKTITGAVTRTSSIDYNLAGQRTRLTYPHTDASNIFYVDYQVYPGTTLLQKATGADGTVYADLSDYQPSGKIGAITYGNNVQTEYGYDGWSQRLLSINTENPNNDILQNRQYTYSPAGDITAIDDLAYVETYYYSYDKLHRLTSETTSTGSIGVIPSIMQMNYDDPDHIHAVSSVVRRGQTHTYDYDSNGNQTSGPDLTNPVTAPIRTLTFNTDNMPVQVVHPEGGTINITYDGEAKRAKKTGASATTYYFSNEFELINNTETCYIFAGNLRVAMVKDHTEKIYFHKEHIGSSTVMTDASGTEKEKTRYMPFGGQRGFTGITTTEYKFTDQELDGETGLYNYDARLYDPILGRFVSADSLVPKVFDSISYNLYAYCANNPMKYVDPSGHYADAYSDTQVEMDAFNEAYEGFYEGYGGYDSFWEPYDKAWGDLEEAKEDAKTRGIIDLIFGWLMAALRRDSSSDGAMLVGISNAMNAGLEQIRSITSAEEDYQRALQEIGWEQEGIQTFNSVQSAPVSPAK